LHDCTCLSVSVWELQPKDDPEDLGWGQGSHWAILEQTQEAELWSLVMSHSCAKSAEWWAFPVPSPQAEGIWRHFLPPFLPSFLPSFHLAIVGFELRLLRLLGRCSTRASSPFALGYFWIGSRVLTRPFWIDILMPIAFCVARMAGVSQYVRFVCWNGVSLTFCPVWPWTTVLISVTQVAGITDVSHCLIFFLRLTVYFLWWVKEPCLKPERNVLFIKGTFGFL
jgi:hypothetical protein